jgi:prepilin-type N-terminal cleavage/methylation domain-containing protein
MNCHSGRRASNRGGANAFTIMEVMVAMFLLALLITAVYGAISNGITTMRMARENLRATQILLERMETIRLYHWEQLKPGFVATNFVANYDVTSKSTNSGILYYGSVSIDPADTGTSYSDDMKLVTVRLNWNTGHITRTRQLTTYVCRTGIQNYVY